MLRIVTQGYRQPHEDTDDFQDIDLWPSLTVAVAKELIAQYERTLVVPMTLANEERFSRMTAGFAKVASSFHHFCLTASSATIHQRLIDRGDEPGSWPFQQTARCVDEHQKSIYAEHIDTESMSSAEATDYVLGRA